MFVSLLRATATFFSTKCCCPCPFPFPSVLFCNLYPNPMPDRIYVPHVFAAFLWLELADLPEGRWSWSYAVSVTVVTAMIATAFVRA